MRTEKQLLELRAQVYTQQRELLERAKGEGRALNADEQASWDKAENDYNAFTREIEMTRNLAEREAQSRAFEQQAPALAKSEKEIRKAEAERWYRTLISGDGVSFQQALALANGAQRASTSSSGDGLYVMPEEFISTLELTMKRFGGMLQASYIHRSATGNPMRWPTHDNTAQTGNWVAEPRSQAITPRGLTFDRKSFEAHTWYDIIGLDWEFIQDEEVGLVGRIIAELIGEAAGRALNKAYTDGDGSGKPTGILASSNGASVGKETAANNAITKQEITDLVHSVDPAYRTTAAFMFSDNILSYLKKLDYGNTDTVPMWMPSFREGEPDRILGFPYVINQDFPTFAAGAKAIAFGDWSKYVIRQVRDVSVLRLDQTYADLMQTAFLGWLRTDGKLLQSAAIKLLKIKA
jgi:HK97 family phage major capsid protein